jgi:hypothetical protein
LSISPKRFNRASAGNIRRIYERELQIKREGYKGRDMDKRSGGSRDKITV